MLSVFFTIKHPQFSHNRAEDSMFLFDIIFNASNSLNWVLQNITSGIYVQFYQCLRKSSFSHIHYIYARHQRKAWGYF